MKHLSFLLVSLAMAVLTIDVSFAQEGLSVYGYFSTRLEKSMSVPFILGNTIVKEDGPAEWSTPFLNIMLGQQLSTKSRIFINLNGSKAGNLDVRNYWGEYTLSNFLTIRAGKIYRKFGLYNEILDAVPTYYGIEPPELFDADHLILTRTTSFMLYGSVDAGSALVRYSLSTDNGESGSPTRANPVGADLNVVLGDGNYVVGVSGYTSGGLTSSDVGLGKGSPKSGVLPWMATDKFSVIGGYVEAKVDRLTLQAEYWNAPHTVERDPASVVEVINNAGVNGTQLQRFLVNPAGAVAANNVRVADTYSVQTYYVRGGYAFETSVGEVAPYVQWDWYKNVETIADKSYGGDDEAGAADDGQFSKATFGVVFRPADEIAVKLDGSSHMYRLNATDVSYLEFRLDVSFIFGH